MKKKADTSVKPAPSRYNEWEIQVLF
jgi:hypothetical protein